MKLEVKHFYQINNLQKNTLGRRHEIDVRLLNCVNLEKYIEDPFEIVFTTDFSEEINLDNKYKLWLICSGAYPNSHEYDGNMSPSDWREYRQNAYMEDLDPEYDFARENLGIFSSTNSENLPQMLYEHGYKSDGLEIHSEDFGIRYKTIYLLNSKDIIVGEAQFEQDFDGFSYNDVYTFLYLLLSLYKSGDEKSIKASAQKIIKQKDLILTESENYEALADLIAKAYPEAPKPAPERIQMGIK